MLAERLCFIAQDILSDLKRTKIAEILNEAANLAASRGNVNDHQYAVSAEAIRSKALEVRTKSTLVTYPKYIRELIFSSNFALSTPERLAEIILSGLPVSRSVGITSAEFHVYINTLNQLIAELSALVNAGRAFNLKQISVPEGSISLDVQIPRAAVASETNALFAVLVRFSRSFTALSELVNGKAESPTLTYASTTDPVTGLTVLLATGTAILVFYKELLEVADKQLNLLKTIREFRKSGLPESDALEKSLNDMIAMRFDQAVRNTLEKLDHKVDEPRAAELTVALKKDGKVMLDAITDGAKVSVTIESLDRVPQLPPAKGAAIDHLQESAERQAIETRIEQMLSDVGRPTPALLTHVKADEA